MKEKGMGKWRSPIGGNWTEDLIQSKLKCFFFNANSVKYIIENLYVYAWESDLLLTTKTGYAYEFEIKISRSDFQNDFKHKGKKHSLITETFKKKLLNEEKESKIARYEMVPNYFYYAVPEGLIDPSEVPEYAGLVYIKDRFPYVETVKKAPKLMVSKFDVDKMGLLDKFYYNYREWKGKARELEEILREIDKRRTKELEKETEAE